jgi:heme exporter protein A
VPLGAVPRAGPRDGRRRGTDGLVTDPAMIRVDALEKRYGERRVLRGVTLAVDRGELHVVTGPNGSGKTTLLRVLVGLAAPSRGTVDVSVDRSLIGYVGHDSHLYADLSALENLELYGRLYRVPERRERIGMLLERFGLWEARSRRVGSFSRGRTQRLALCRALLHEPELLVLDEPYSALDTDGAALLDDELAPSGRTRAIVVATHEPERLAPLATGHLALGAA